MNEHIRTAAVEMCEAIRAVSSFSAVVTLLQSEDGAILSPAGWLLAGGDPGEVELTESALGNGPGARALSLGVSVVYSDADNPSADLPLWASARGFTTGIIIPLLRHGTTFGVLYALKRDPEPPTEEEIHLSELAVLHGSRPLPVLVRNRFNDMGEEMAGFTPDIHRAVRDLAPLKLDRVQIDPQREMARLGETEVSLSRTEFLMLYTLGSKANEVVPHHVLLEICWPDDFPALSAVDATVYRLRKKLSLAAENAGKEIVKTVRGKGYMLSVESLAI